MKMKRKLILSLLAMLLPISAWCADGDTFEYTSGNTKFYFRVISEDSKTVELFKGNYKAAVESATGGALETTITVPSIAVNNTTNYSVTKIGKFAFYQCIRVLNVELPEGITDIDEYGFENAVQLGSVTIPTTVTSIGDNAFNGCALSSVTLPNGLQSIGLWAFGSCPLSAIEIPASVTSIDEYAFSDNNQLTSISVASGNPNYNSTGDCNAIIKTATNELIVGCKSTVIPNTVISIGNGAFKGAGITGTFSIPNSVTTIGLAAFQSNNISTLEIPASVNDIGQSAFADSYTSVSVAPGNEAYKTVNNCIIHKLLDRLESVGKNVTSIPDGVRVIGSSVFSNSSISSIEIPSTVKEIGGNAFEYCENLASVTLNEGLTLIGEFAFSNCSALHNLTIPTTVKTIGYHALNETGYSFSGEKSLALSIPYTLNIDPISSQDILGFYTYYNYVTVTPYVKPAKEFTSFACPQDVDFSGATGLKAYVASGFDASAKKVSLKEVTSAKAGEGIIIQATAGTKYDLALATASDNGTNLLVGVTADTAIEPTDCSNTNFLLSDGQFLKAQAGTLANGKAYLQLPTSATARAKSLGITTEGDVTGIINIDLDEEGDGMIYDLNGRRISETATKGIYVKNGKKVIIK